MPAPELMELNVVTDSPYVKLIRFNKMFKSTKDITVKCSSLKFHGIKTIKSQLQNNQGKLKCSKRWPPFFLSRAKRQSF